MKRALAVAFDKHAREREMTSVLLSTLYNEVRLMYDKCATTDCLEKKWRCARVGREREMTSVLLSTLYNEVELCARAGEAHAHALWDGNEQS